MKKFLVALFALSLVANQVAAQEGDDRDFGHRAGIFEGLSVEKQEMLKKVHEKNADARKANKEQVKALFAKKNEIMTAEKFDKAAYIENSKKMQEIFNKAAQQRTEAMAEALSQLTQAERAAIVEKMAAKKDGMHKGKKFGPKGERGEMRKKQ